MFPPKKNRTSELISASYIKTQTQSMVKN